MDSQDKLLAAILEELKQQREELKQQREATTRLEEQSKQQREELKQQREELVKLRELQIESTRKLTKNQGYLRSTIQGVHQELATGYIETQKMFKALEQKVEDFQTESQQELKMVIESVNDSKRWFAKQIQEVKNSITERIESIVDKVDNLA